MAHSKHRMVKNRPFRSRAKPSLQKTRSVKITPCSAVVLTLYFHGVYTVWVVQFEHQRWQWCSFKQPNFRSALGIIPTIVSTWKFDFVLLEIDHAERKGFELHISKTKSPPNNNFSFQLIFKVFPLIRFLWRTPFIFGQENGRTDRRCVRTWLGLYHRY